jgi:Flp pilus assembly protein TadD
MLLAALYERDGKLQAAEEQHQELVRETKSAPAIVVNYVEYLLRRDRPGDAEEQLAAIEETIRSSSLRDRTRFTVLKGKCLKMQSRQAEALSLVKQLADEIGTGVPDNEKAARLNLVAQAYESLEFFDQAAAARRKLVTVMPKAYPLLARDLCLAGKYDDALQIFLDVKDGDQDKPEYASLVMSVLATGETPIETLQRLETMLAKLAQRHPDHPDVLYATATLRAIQDRNEEAAMLLEKANQLRPRNVPILNNLATLLAETPGRQADALRYVDEAIAIVGEQPALLDTKGTILLQMGDARAAVELLQQTASTPYPDPRFLLHLAFAHDQNEDAEEARLALRKSIEMDVHAQVLTKADKELLDKLRSKYREVPTSVRGDDEPIPSS